MELEIVLHKEWFAVAVLLSLLSGFGAYLERVRSGDMSHSLVLFLAEIITAVMAGLIVAFIFESQNHNRLLMYATVLVASNNGSELINSVKTAVFSRMKILFEVKK